MAVSISSGTFRGMLSPSLITLTVTMKLPPFVREQGERLPVGTAGFEPASAGVKGPVLSPG